MNDRNLRNIGIPITICSGGLLSMSLIAYFLQNETIPLWMISQHKIVNFTFTMQMMVLPISFIALALMYLYNKEHFRKFFRLGTSSFDKSNNWNSFGPIIAVSFTIGTALLMSVSVISQNGSVNRSFFFIDPIRITFFRDQCVVRRNI